MLTTRDQIEHWSTSFKTAPVAARLRGVTRAPFDVFRAAGRPAFILESLADGPGQGRFTYLGFAPVQTLTSRDGIARIVGDGPLTGEPGSPTQVLTRALSDIAGPRVPGLPPFTGGLVGYVGFDGLDGSPVPVPRESRDDEGFSDLDLKLFDRVVAFDHLTGDIWCLVTITLDAPDDNYARAAGVCEELAALVQHGTPVTPAPLQVYAPFEPLLDSVAFGRAVRTIQDHIRGGNLYQAALSNRLVAPCEGTLLETYRLLRDTDPCPYMFYLVTDDFEVAGASLGTLARCVGAQVETCPPGASCPRGDATDDEAGLVAALVGDERTLARHATLLDVACSDVGGISRPGTVEVDDYLRVRRLPHVLSADTTVRGLMRFGVGPADVLDALLPSAALCGAPRDAARALLDHWEGVRRGVYGGAVGYVACSGDLDVCAPDRLVSMRGGHVHARASVVVDAGTAPDPAYDDVVAALHGLVAAIDAPAPGGSFDSGDSAPAAPDQREGDGA